MLENSARYIKGVGPKKLKILQRINVSSISDCLYYLPRRYEDRSNLKTISQLKVDEFQTFKARVKSSSIFKAKTGTTIFQVILEDDEGAKIYALWFNQPYMKRYFEENDNLILYGKIQKRARLQVVHPEYENIDKADLGKDTIHTGRIVPVYPLAQGVNQRRLRAIIKNCIDQYASYIKDFMPTDVRARCHLLDLKSAVCNIHFPVNERQKNEARRRLVFNEFFILQLALALRRYKIKYAPQGIKHEITEDFRKQFLKTLDFSLTNAQVKAIDTIEQDMKGSAPMHRLLQGDVASGKTAVSAYALALTAHNNHQGLIMVPTEILARQHYITLSQIFALLGIETVLLISSMSKKEKEDALSLIKKGEAQVIIGTHALIQEGIEYKDLGLVVIDEQHKFGVEQRAFFKKKGFHPDVLIMSATPIPRTLAMSLYGDMDMSIIDEMPHGPRKVQTTLIDSSQKQAAYDFMKEEVKAKRKGYIVCPVIEDSPKLQIEGAEKTYQQLKSLFPDFKLGLMHGRLKGEEKGKRMKNFKKGKIDILVCTTVIEVGIDIPDASVMIIENAERFGLSQLHQMRGRIGRGKQQSYCILISDKQTETSISRLEAMTRTDDGFKIAEEDMSIRGTGDLFGKRQHGMPALGIADLTKDIDVLEQARKEAFSLISCDPGFKDERHNPLKEKLLTEFKEKFALGLIG